MHTRAVLAIPVVLALTTGPSVGQPPSTPSSVWLARYDAAAQDDLAESVAVTQDGTKVFVTGRFDGPDTLDFGTIAFDAASGAQLWTATYDGGENDSAVAVQSSPDGGTVYVTGYSSGPGLNYDDYLTVAYDADDGSQVWAARTDEGSSDRPNALALSPDGERVYVTGGAANEGILTTGYDAATGALLWASSWRDGTGQVAFDIAVSPDNTRVYLTGGYWTGASQATLTLALNAVTGHTFWEAIHDPGVGNEDFALALAVSPDGSRLFIAGSHEVEPMPQDYQVIAYDAHLGTQVWMSTYDGTGHGNDFGRAVAVTPDGSTVVVTGNSDGPGTTDDYATVALRSSNGVQRWASRYSGPANGIDQAHALAFRPDGRQVFVTGTSAGSGTGNDFLTVAYSTRQGSQLWVMRYNNAQANGNDVAVAIASTSTAVFVTGNSLGLGTGQDYATMARTL